MTEQTLFGAIWELVGKRSDDIHGRMAVLTKDS